MSKRIDWELVEENIKAQGYTKASLSRALGKSNSYISRAQKTGEITNQVINQIAEILHLDTIYIKPDKTAPLTKETGGLVFPESEFEKTVKAELSEIKLLLGKLLESTNVQATGTSVEEAVNQEKKAKEDQKKKAADLLEKLINENGWQRYNELMGKATEMHINNQYMERAIKEALKDGNIRLHTTGYGDNATKWVVKDKGGDIE